MTDKKKAVVLTSEAFYEWLEQQMPLPQHVTKVILVAQVGQPLKVYYETHGIADLKNASPLPPGAILASELLPEIFEEVETLDDRNT